MNYYADDKEMSYYPTEIRRNLRSIITEGKRPVWKAIEYIFPMIDCSRKGKTVEVVKRSVLIRGLRRRKGTYVENKELLGQ